MSDNAQDRRRHSRLEFQAPFKYRPAEMHDAFARELSVAGITFVTDEPLAPGTELDLYLINCNVHLQGVVTHQERHGDQEYRTGVHFLRDEPELVEVLAAAWRVQRI